MSLPQSEYSESKENSKPITTTQVPTGLLVKQEQVDSSTNQASINSLAQTAPILFTKPATDKHDNKPVNDKTGSKFWSDDPNVLLQQDSMFELFPVSTMTYEQKLNAISRTIIIISLITFAVTRNIRILVILAITLFAIFILYYYQEKPQTKKGVKSEGFDDAGIAYLNQNEIKPNVTFTKPTSHNPFNNVMLPDYDYNPNKKPAPAAYTESTSNEILIQAKKLVVESNPDQPDIADKLFTDLGDNLSFEQSLRPFNSNPSTTIPNDQSAFADFCYGSMVSCKEGNLFACARNLARHIN